MLSLDQFHQVQLTMITTQAIRHKSDENVSEMAGGFGRREKRPQLELRSMSKTVEFVVAKACDSFLRKTLVQSHSFGSDAEFLANKLGFLLWLSRSFSEVIAGHRRTNVPLLDKDKT